MTNKSSTKLHDRYELFWSRLIKKGFLFSKDPWHYSSKIPYRSVGDFSKYISNKISGKKLLDVGVGNGKHAIYFTKKNFSVWGIDISESAIKFAKNYCDIMHAQVNLRVGNVMRLPYPHEFFDVVLDSGCLHHLKVSEWKCYINNIKKVLKRGGYLFVLAFSDKTKIVRKLGKRQGKKRNWSIRNEHYYHYFSKKEILKMFGDDFQLVKCYDIRRSDSPIHFRISYLLKK